MEFSFADGGGLIHFVNQKVAVRQARGMRLEKVAIPEFMAPFSQPLEVFRDLTGEVITPKLYTSS